MHSPLSNFFYRPRSTQHRFRRSCSSHSSPLQLSPISSTSCTSSSTDPKYSSAANSQELTNQSSASDNAQHGSYSPGVPKHGASHEQMVSDTTPSYTPSFESPFPSPYSLNVPLSSSGTYLCTLTLSSQDATSLSLASGLLYTGLPSGDIRVFQTPRLAECAHFGIGSLPVKALLVTSDTIFTAHKDYKIRVWHRPDAEGGAYNLLKTLPTAADFLRNFVFNKRYIQVRRHHRRLWIQHIDTITALALDSASQLLFSASWDKTFKVWNLRNMRCVQSVKAHDDAIHAILVSSQPDAFIYTASADSTVKVWKKLSAQKIVHAATLAGHSASVNALVMKPDSERSELLYSGSSDCCIHVWERVARNKLAWKLATTLRGHRSPVLCLAVSGPLVCSGGADKMVRVWRRGRLGSYTCLAILQGHGGPVKSVAIAVNTLRSCYVYSASLDSTIKVWSVLFEREEHDDASHTSLKKY